MLLFVARICVEAPFPCVFMRDVFGFITQCFQMLRKLWLRKPLLFNTTSFWLGFEGAQSLVVKPTVLRINPATQQPTNQPTNQPAIQPADCWQTHKNARVKPKPPSCHVMLLHFRGDCRGAPVVKCFVFSVSPPAKKKKKHVWVFLKIRDRFLQAVGFLWFPLAPEQSPYGSVFFEGTISE